jgi:ADP-ribose pyrophosphatase
MIVYSNPWFCVRKDEGFHFVEETIGMAGAAVITIVGSDLVLLDMMRVSQGDHTLEIPRGYAKIGESQQQCAARELLEETGLSVDPDTLELLGHVRPNTGILRSRIPLYLAKIPAETQRGQRDKEARKLVFIPMTELTIAIRNGLIEDGFALSALALFAAYDVSSG